MKKSRPMSRRFFLKAMSSTALAGAAFCSGALTWQEAQAEALKNNEKVVPTWCGMCGPASNCAIYAFVDQEGRFKRVKGMKEAPQNKGTLCAKAHAAPQWVYSPDRIPYPMKRVGAKGEGKFARITWDEAIHAITTELQKQKAEFGAESLAILSPARRDYSEYLYRLLMVHGSPNYAHSGICATQLSFALSYTLGCRPSPDYNNADLILVWGKQPVYSAPALGGSNKLIDAQNRKAYIVGIKPSVEPDGCFASEWVPVRPGTDAALALAMIHVIIGENLIDKAFVDQYCYGFDKLAEHVKQYSPEWAEKITGVSAKQIIELARRYAKTPQACIDYGNGLEHAASASDAIRSIAILMAITGHLDKKGCNLFPAKTVDMPGSKSIHMKNLYTEEWLDRLVGPEFPKAFQPFGEGMSSCYYKVFEDVLSDKPTIHAMIAPGTQPSVSTRNPRGVLKALEKVFYVVADTSRTADMNWADIVIPTLTPYEIDHPYGVRGPLLMARNQVIKPVTEGKSMQEFMIDLGTAMGYGEYFWNGDIKACQDDLISPFGMTVEELRTHKTGIVYKPVERGYENYEKTFKNPSPKLDKSPYLAENKVALYNTNFEKAGFSPMPQWVEAPESLTGTPELAQEYPLIMSDYHTSISYSAAWQRNVPSLREVEPDPVLHIHPETAQAQNIQDGDKIKITSPHGELRGKALYYPGIRKDTVMMLHGWWQGCSELNKEDMPLLDGGANVNLLYSADPKKILDPLISAMSSQTLVKVEKI